MKKGPFLLEWAFFMTTYVSQIKNLMSPDDAELLNE